MRFLIVDTDYPPFLDWLYGQHVNLRRKSYEDQMKVRVETFFAFGGAYAINLTKLGYQANQIFFNNEHMQAAWARQHGLTINRRWQFRLRRGVVPWLSRSNEPDWLYEVLTAQIKYYKPDVLINNAMRLSSTYFQQIKPYLRLLVGTHGAPLPEERDWGVYDLVLSVVDNFVNYFRRQGLNSELLRLAFEPAVLEKINGSERSFPVSFVGQLSSAHNARREWLEDVCQRIPVQVWGFPNAFRDGSPIASRYQGAAWGVEMYRILGSSLLTLNNHIDVAGAYAGNLRLFEATGVGTLLVTDWKKNLHEMFATGEEVVAYRSADECAEIVQYYLEHDEKRAAIARAGQQRTLRDHTYYHRAQELVAILQKRL